MKYKLLIFYFTFMVLDLFLSLKLNLNLALAANCIPNTEFNQVTKKNFFNAEAYQKALYIWQSRRPSLPNPINLSLAYKTFVNDKAQIELISSSDKVAHCFVGCRIAKAINFETADFVGWLKEEIDLTDCRHKSQFDESDYNATLRGAQLGVNPRINCLHTCRQIY